MFPEKIEFDLAYLLPESLPDHSKRLENGTINFLNFDISVADLQAQLDYIGWSHYIDFIARVD